MQIQHILKLIYHGVQSIGGKLISTIVRKIIISIFAVFYLIQNESHSLQLQVERVLSICRRLDPGSLFLRNKSY